MFQALDMLHSPELDNPAMIAGFSGWMDGGEVSTGTVEYLVEKLDAQPFARIAPDNFFISNFPASMEAASLFRPHVKIENGLITEFEEAENLFFYSEAENLILFTGKEPNLRWHEFGDSFFALAAAQHVSRIVFAGSVAGSVPHTRNPRFHFSVSDAAMIDELARFDMAPSNYEGPGSFMTWLTLEAGPRGIPVASLVAEVPAYLQGRNARCVEAMVSRIKAVAGLGIAVDDLKILSLEFEKQVSEVVKTRPELAELIAGIEKEYDKETLDSQRGDLRDWFEKQNIRLD
jgi:proteasome assembly chaperone (PAC2) family protein